jgi:gas vesicle protein
MDNRNEIGMLAVGLIVGALTGAVIALLYAPQSGEQTRTQVREKSIELTRQVKEQAETLRTRGAGAVESETAI